MEKTYKLPSMEHTFEINRKGSVTGQIFKGSFTYRRLSLGDQGKSGVLKARLNGDLENIDMDTDKFHEMISWMRYGFVDYPEWWRESNFGVDLYDLNIVEELWKTCNDFERKWLEQLVKGKAENDQSPQLDSIK